MRGRHGVPAPGDERAHTFREYVGGIDYKGKESEPTSDNIAEEITRYFNKFDKNQAKEIAMDL